MKRRRTRARGPAGIGAALFTVALASACAPKGAPRQTDIMVKTGSVEVSAAVLRAQVNDLAERLAGRLEVTADRVRAGTQDRAIRLNALALKTGGIPAVYTAAYRADPLTAALDVWGLAFQFDRFVDGAARDSFGAQQPLLRECADAILADSDALVEAITVSREAFGRARERVKGWADTHPVEHTFASRPSIAPFMATARSERDAFVAVGTVSDTLENVSERLNTYAAQLPKQARWQAELLADEMAETDQVRAAIGDVQAMGTAARRADALMADMAELLEPGGPAFREAVAAERLALLAGVDAQRLHTLEFVSTERRAMLAVLRDERMESLKEVDAIKTRGVESAVVGLQEVVDYALWRVGALCLILMVCAAALIVIAYRLTVGRPGAATP